MCRICLAYAGFSLCATILFNHVSCGPDLVLPGHQLQGCLKTFQADELVPFHQGTNQVVVSRLHLRFGCIGKSR